MTQKSKLNALGHVLYSLTKHGMAVGVSIAFLTALCIILLIALYLAAIITNSGLGSPLVPILYPLAAIILSAGYSVLLLFPATSLAEWVCAAKLKISFLWQIPVSSLFLLLELLFLSILLQLLFTDTLDLRLTKLTVGWAELLLAIPLGIYWSTLKTADGIQSLSAWFLRKAVDSYRGTRGNTSAEQDPDGHLVHTT